MYTPRTYYRTSSTVRALLAEIRAVSETQVSLLKPTTTPPKPPAPSKQTAIAIQSKPPSATKNRFARFTAHFRHLCNKYRDNMYVKMEEGDDTSSDTLSTRRASGDSDKTLVGDDTAGQLLELLAPIVSGIQRVAAQVKVAVGTGEISVKKDFEEVCEEMLRLITGLKHGYEKTEDGHDGEMRGLMLEALSKKVSAELATVRARKAGPTSATSPPNKPSSSPLALVAENPFIVHASSLNTTQNPMFHPSTRRASSEPKRIPAADTEQTMPPGSFSAFTGTAQASVWGLNNIFRLGSYQSTMLFSPSPIAVRRNTGSGRRV
jgi:DNA-binding ferritin-like protein